jgi:uncharacterized membrane-anchored protein
MSWVRKWRWPLLIIVALIQSAALLKIVYDRDKLLKTGREVMLPVHPLDPRDVFRGDYVTLGYDFTSIRKSGVPAQADFETLRSGSDAYVTLHPDAAGTWAVAAVTPGYPRDLPPGDVVLRGRVKSVWRADSNADAQLTLMYGIESYFVPEGTGRALEDKVREHKISAIVAVDSSGTAALKGLLVDGERHVDPPLL